MEIEVAVKAELASSPPRTKAIQRTFEEAILCYLFGSPEQEEKALKKIKAIIDFNSKYKLLD